MAFNGIKVFSATMHRDRDTLGEKITEWIRTSGVEIVDLIVRQSSDSEYHCISIVVLFNEPIAGRAAGTRH
jgi:hypothetical protein